MKTLRMIIATLLLSRLLKLPVARFQLAASKTVLRPRPLGTGTSSVASLPLTLGWTGTKMGSPVRSSFYLLPLLAFLGLNCAFADTAIPGTQVSYLLKTDALTNGNASMVFIDEPSDPSGQTYATFACDLDDPYFRMDSKVAVGTFTGERVYVFYRADNGSLRSTTATVRENRKTGKLSVLDFGYVASNEVLRTFLAAQSKVVIRLQAQDIAPRTLTFSTTGFVRGFRAINQCD